MDYLKILLTSIFVYLINISYGQDKLLVNINIGNSLSYNIRGQLNFPEENSYLWGFIGYYDDVKFAGSLGITHETKTFNFLQKTMYLTTQTNLSYRASGENKLQEQLLFSNDIYLPKRIKDNRLRWFVGIRNSYVFLDSTDDIYIGFHQYRYQLGLTSLLDYQLNNKWHIGINAYASTRKLANNRTNTRVHTAEALLKISYNIR